MVATRCKLETNECKTFNDYSLDFCLVARMLQMPIYANLFKMITPRFECPVKAVSGNELFPKFTI